MKNKIIKHFKTGYQSSPVTITNREINLLTKTDCECQNCGKSIFDMDDFPNINFKESEVLCERCHTEEYMETCPICEEYYYKPEKKEKQFLIISKEAVKEYQLSVKPGFYKVKKKPFFYGDCITGFDGLFNENIELVREVDINSILFKLYSHNGKEKVTADTCCSDCVNKYTANKKISNNYFDKQYGKKLV